MSPFPAPATSNGANGFPVRRSPARFAPRVMGPSGRRVLSGRAPRPTRLHRVQPHQPSPWRRSPAAGPAACRAFFSCAPASRVGGGSAEQQGPFAPRALPRLLATAGPSATRSSSADFPGDPRLYDLPSFRPSRAGTRRASPVARSILVTVLSLPPRRSGLSDRPASDSPCCLRPALGGSASGAILFGATCAFACATAR